MIGSFFTSGGNSMLNTSATENKRLKQLWNEKRRLRKGLRKNQHLNQSPVCLMILTQLRHWCWSFCFVWRLAKMRLIVVLGCSVCCEREISKKLSSWCTQHLRWSLQVPVLNAAFSILPVKHLTGGERGSTYQPHIKSYQQFASCYFRLSESHSYYCWV